MEQQVDPDRVEIGLRNAAGPVRFESQARPAGQRLAGDGVAGAGRAGV